jgi:hypothetical protein
MYDVVGGMNDLRRQVSRRRAEQTMRRLGQDLASVRRDLDDVRSDVYRGVFVKEARRVAGTIASSLPTARRRRRPNPVAVSAPVLAVLAVAGVGAVLLWDERRRAAMRRRLDEVVSGVGSNLNRAAPEPPVPVS